MRIDGEDWLGGFFVGCMWYIYEPYVPDIDGWIDRYIDT